ncbi:DUF1002 domain-containing protein [Lacticaseibacillus rhamnosus]|uniref:DUF1002 domain-containing protein n=1 Tax=Lacticaseibacillus rhamnosus TaxID=47715 RepID=UPI0007E18C97|nr:DUF1002 domain-containing protein [Lacticaseibacillus rhamnosus]MBB1165213.1 DUF1002 domain-containing protein [Lacticaseibacillus rhamnosus]MCT3191480.1 DUF1002 domain-containing protein [Lacticaseibacillus rhamnosus]MCT3371352.1 DUF1002 domain-containing protein [Lacticaseibacillus rhamnosus]MCZ2733360.1 DUF1002 domain-containing protein [Lacticaseibacillus rhamnosus]MCZ2736008.1 DUF1002 domain-containing protein [Lacticaseibacillus rhamnosus]
MKKLIKWLGLAAAGLALITAVPQVVRADDAWTQPVATLGSSLTTDQKNGTLSTLQNAAGVSNATQLTVNGATLVKYLNPSGSSFTESSGVWSSALVQKTNNGGINVTIVPYNGTNNITMITADQYRNAALTAGVSNANLYITSAVKIDGSGALAGVYAAFAQNGENLNNQQINAAQQEVNTLSSITQANKGKDGYTDKQLNNAVAGAKQQMASQSNNGQQTLSQNQIGNIVDSQLKQNNLTTIINNNQRQLIINLLVNVQKAGSLKNTDFKAQAGKLADSIQNSAKGLFDKLNSSLNTQENRNFLQKIWDGIVSFFSGIVQWVRSMF